MKTILFAAMLVAATAYANGKWTQEPSAVRGVPFGASQEQARRQLKLDPGACGGSHAKSDCVAVEKVTPFFQESYLFENDKLVRVVSAFTSRQYDAVKRSLITTYGQPATTETNTIKTRSGTEFKNETLLWIGGRVSLKLLRYSFDFNHGSATFAVHEITKSAGTGRR